MSNECNVKVSTKYIISEHLIIYGGLMVNALVSGASSPGSSPGQGHRVVYLGKSLYFHSASLHPLRYINGYQQT